MACAIPAYPASSATVEVVLIDVAQSRDWGTSVERASVHECWACFVHPKTVSLTRLPMESRRDDVKVLRITESEVSSVSPPVGRSPGSPNAFLEVLLGAPVTTRRWKTGVRPVQWYA